MMDIYIYGDIQDKVRKRCKKRFKKGFFDSLWKKEVKKIMMLPISDIYEFLEKIPLTKEETEKSVQESVTNASIILYTAYKGANCEKGIESIINLQGKNYKLTFELEK